MTKRCRICGDALSPSDPLYYTLDTCGSCQLRSSTGLLSMTDSELTGHIDALELRISSAKNETERLVLGCAQSMFHREIGTRRIARRHLGLPEGFGDE